jgi:Calcium binding
MAREKKQTNKGRRRGAHRQVTRRQLETLIEEAIIDAYGESEQRVGFLTMLEEHLTVPFMTEVLGVAVRVARVDLNDADEIVAICRRGQQRQSIRILDLPLPSPPPDGWEWIEAYRHWTRGGR